MQPPLPAPIAVPLAEYRAESRPFARLHRLVDTYEATLKYASLLAIQNFYTDHLTDAFPKVDHLIRERISRPHLGDWAGFLRQVLQCFAEREGDLFCRDLYLFHFKRFGPGPKPQKAFADQGASERLLSLRNLLGHGATLPDEEADGLVSEYEPALEILLKQAAFLSDLPLYCVLAQVEEGAFRAQPLIGADYRSSESLTLQAASLPVGHVAVHNPQTGAFLDLHPLLVYAVCLEELPQWDEKHRLIGKMLCRQRKLLFYNDLKAADRINFLDYWRGHHSRFQSPHPMAAEFRTQFPRPSRPVEKANWFNEFIANATTHFVGRETELDRLDRFAAGGGKRVLVVVSAPGMGKSALLARWADQHQALRHFIRQGDAATCDTVRIFENLGRQLSERFGVEWKPPQKLDPSEYRQAFDETLKAVAKKVPLVIVLDGLDEAVRELSYGQGMESANTIVNWLPESGMLPEGVLLLVAIRPELLEHSAFAAKFSQDKAAHLNLDRMTDSDVRALLYQVRSKYEVLEAPQYVEAIVSRSEGSPLYLRMLLEDLSEGRLTFGQIDHLPVGMIAYFDRILEFIEREGRSREMPEVESLLRAKQETYDALVADGTLTRDDAHTRLTHERFTLEGRATLKSVEVLALYSLARDPLTLSESAAILDAASADVYRAFEIIRTVLVGNYESGFALFHTGFREYFLHIQANTELRVHRHSKTIAAVQDRLCDRCVRWQEYALDNAASKYIFLHGIFHLLSAGRLEDVCTLVSASSDWMNVKFGVLHSDESLANDLNYALRSLECCRDARQAKALVQLHTARQLITLRTHLPDQALDVLVRTGRLGEAIGQARLRDTVENQLNGLVTICEALDHDKLNNDGLFGETVNLALGIVDGPFTNTKERVAILLWEVGRYVDAMTLVKSIRHDKMRARAICALAVRNEANIAGATTPRFADAVDEARVIVHMHDRATALLHCADVMYSLNPQESAEVLRECLDTAVAIQDAPDIVYPRAERILCGIAIKYNRFDPALSESILKEVRRRADALTASVRNYVLKDLAECFVKSCMFAEAMSICNDVDDFAVRNSLVLKIAVGMAECGDVRADDFFDQAIEMQVSDIVTASATVAELKSSGQVIVSQQIDWKELEIGFNSTSLCRIVLALAESGRIEKAKATIDFIPTVERRALAASYLSKHLSHVGQFDDAIKIAEDIGYTDWRTDALLQISSDLARICDSRAVHLLTQYIDLELTYRNRLDPKTCVELVTLAAANGHIRHALLLADSIDNGAPLLRVRAYCNLVSLSRNATDVDEPRIMETIESCISQLTDSSVIDALCEFAKIVCITNNVKALGMLDNAARIGRNIQDINRIQNASALRKVAAAMRACGDPHADTILQEAIAVAMTVKGYVDWTSELCEHAVFLSQIGDPHGQWLFEQIDARLLSIDHDFSRNRSAAVLSGALARAGSRRRAFDCAASIHDSRERAFAYLEITKALIEAHDLPEAIEAAHAIESNWKRAEALALVGSAASIERVGGSDLFLEEANAALSAISDRGEWYHPSRILADALASNGQYNAALTVLGPRDPNEYVQVLANWNSGFNAIEAGLSIPLMQDTMRMIGWLIPQFREVEKMLP